MFQELVDAAFYSRESYIRGLVGGTGGNTSVRIGDDMFITATGCTLGDVQPQDLIRVPMDGEAEPQPNGARPSKELFLHRAIYKVRPDIKAVLHLHPVNSIAVALLADSLDEEMPSYTPAFKAKIRYLPQVDYHFPGSKDLAEATSARFAQTDCVLMRNHGLIVGAETIKKAFTQVEEIEENAKLHLILNGKGALSAEIIKELREKLGF